MNLHIITGGSRGLGAALVKFFIDQGDHVVEVSRSGTNQIKGLRSYEFDLSGNASKADLMAKIFSDFPIHNYQSITLTNNAGMVDPIKHIDQLEERSVEQNVLVNLVAPISLTAAFLKLSSAFKGVRVISNISTGVAKNPKASWAVYSAAKAGLESFSEALAKEFSNNSKVKIINFEPGIIDTEMQALIRSTSPEDFSEVDKFLKFKNENQLLEPRVVAEALGSLTLNSNLPQFSRVSVYDLISEHQ